MIRELLADLSKLSVRSGGYDGAWILIYEWSHSSKSFDRCYVPLKPWIWLRWTHKLNFTCYCLFWWLLLHISNLQLRGKTQLCFQFLCFLQGTTQTLSGKQHRKENSVFSTEIKMLDLCVHTPHEGVHSIYRRIPVRECDYSYISIHASDVRRRIPSTGIRPFLWLVFLPHWELKATSQRYNSSHLEEVRSV